MEKYYVPGFSRHGYILRLESKHRKIFCAWILGTERISVPGTILAHYHRVCLTKFTFVPLEIGI